MSAMPPDQNHARLVGVRSQSAPALRAAQYVRMSTEHQQYSTQNQRDMIRNYADLRGIEVVRTYADEGKSGLRIDGRAALQQLLRDVESGQTDFSIILVYDVSRWGRFQDADESAYYEYLCRRAGIQVTYCAEQFENDGSPVSTIVKGVKRAMAAEYSRELSAKVSAGKRRLIELGYRQGGPAGFGLRRVLIDQTGKAKGVLAPGEYKNLQTDRVILMPGPQEEIRIVNLMYQWFISDGLDETDIADRLNIMNIRPQGDRTWTCDSVRGVLTNEKYIGHNVNNRRASKLNRYLGLNAPEMWVRKNSAFQGIVPQDVFESAQAIIRARRIVPATDEELIDRLRRLYSDKGTLSADLINETQGMPSHWLYVARFGTLTRAYELAGYHPVRDCQYLQGGYGQRRRLYPKVLTRTEQRLESLGCSVRVDPRTNALLLNNELTAVVLLARCITAPTGARRWRVRIRSKAAPDITIAVRLDSDNRTELDYYVFPGLLFQNVTLSLAERNAAEVDCFRFDTLEFFYGMSKRNRLRRII